MRGLVLDTPFKVLRSKDVKLLVIHHIGSKNGKLYSVKGTIDWFTKKSLHLNPATGNIENKVSSHFIVPRNVYKDDEKEYDIIQLATDDYVTYHAGISSWTLDGKLVKGLNGWSIGWELEGDGNLIEYTDLQYEALIESLREKLRKFQLTIDSIVGHEDIAPGRKVDPGKYFDWKRVRLALEPKVLVQVPREDEEGKLGEVREPEEIKEEFVPDEQMKMEGGEEKVELFEKIIEVLKKLFKSR